MSKSGTGPRPREGSRRACAAVVEAVESRLLFSTLPAGFAESAFGGGLHRPTAMAFAPDGRLFVAEQGSAGSAKLRVIKNGSLLATPFVSVNVDSQGERGLLGVTFDPNFASNKFVYVYYTVPETTSAAAHNRLSRFTADAANGDVAGAGSERVLLDLDPLGSATIHNGGSLHFAGGRLFVTVGENATPANAQSLANLKGKVLRLNADGSIPADNPFFNTATGNNRAIWALGLRNPFSMAVQPGTNRIFINDVGSSRRADTSGNVTYEAWEEINEGAAGANFGWPGIEGPRGAQTPPANYRDPFYAYSHAGGRRAIAGGSFYHPPAGQASPPRFPSQYVGDYFFGDHQNKTIQVLDPATAAVSPFAQAVGNLVDVDAGPDGALYYLRYGFSDTPGSGGVFRIRYTGVATAPTITSHPSGRTVAVGQSVTFSVTASGTAPLSYQWQRNGANIAGATATSYTLASPQLGDGGAAFRCVVSNSAGSTPSNAATLTVTASQAPRAVINTPAAGTLYRAGTTISFAGDATDAEDGTLPAGAFTWAINLHHADHTHPAREPFGGVKGGTFTIPTVGETDHNVFYRIHLTVRDRHGLTHSVFRDVLPRKARINLATNPAGLKVTLDGNPLTAPTSVLGVSGIRRALGVQSPQTLNGATYEFVSWSDGGAATHTISTPDVDTTYTATYRVASSTNGLKGEYFDNRDFTGTKVTRVDPAINFNFGTASPVPGTIGADTFSVRWTGQVLANFSETYTFHTSSDDGVRVWVDGRMVIDSFINQNGSVERSGTIALTAGRKYALKVEYYDDSGGALVRLRYSSPSTAKQIIPNSALFQPVAAVTLGATADAHVRDGTHAGTNFGSAGTLEVKKYGTAGFTREGYLRFDLTNVATIANAKLRLFGRLTAAGSVATQVFGASGASWTETGVTYSNRPATTTAALASATVSSTAGAWIEWDVTSFLKAEKAAGRNVVTLVLRNAAVSEPMTVFESRQSANAGARPQLVVS